MNDFVEGSDAAIRLISRSFGLDFPAGESAEKRCEKLCEMLDARDLKVAAAAIKVGDLVFSLPRPARHHNILRHMHEIGVKGGPSWIAGQGFLLSDGRWVSREEAFEVAKGAGQLNDRVSFRPKLFSEDVW